MCVCNICKLHTDDRHYAKCFTYIILHNPYESPLLLLFSHWSCPTLCDYMDCRMPSFPVLHHLLEKTMSIEPVMPFNLLVLCPPLLFLCSIFPSIRVFSNEVTLHIRWPKYWSFSFSISPSVNIQG